MRSPAPTPLPVPLTAQASLISRCHYFGNFSVPLALRKLLPSRRTFMGIQVTLPQQGYETLRRWPRYKIDVPVRLIAQRPTKVAIVQGRGRELGRGGMDVFAGVDLSIDAQVAVEFTPPYAGQPIRVRGFVRNRNGYTYGIEFITENDADYRNVGQLESILKNLGSAS